MTAQAGGTTSSLAQRKSALRRSLRELRRSIPPSRRRHAALRAALHVARAARRCGARHVAVYLSLGGEIDTAPAIDALRRQGCTLYVPKVGGDGRLRFARLQPPLRRNRYGIAEPVLLKRPPRLDLILLPLVAFDAQGRRLGMGGGYYDRLLERARASRRPLRVGHAFGVQQVAAVPVAAHDARLDAVITERGFRRFR